MCLGLGPTGSKGGGWCQFGTNLKGKWGKLFYPQTGGVDTASSH
jgi:hypothetical protein